MSLLRSASAASVESGRRESWGREEVKAVDERVLRLMGGQDNDGGGERREREGRWVWECKAYLLFVTP